MVRNAREEYQRRGGYVRIFPTADTWQNYGALLEYSSQNNLILHEQLYPNATRKAQRLNRRSVAMVGQKRFDFFRYLRDHCYFFFLEHSVVVRHVSFDLREKSGYLVFSLMALVCTLWRV